ncbi:uncharacterized protein LOC113564553 isoform X2 [Drosophila erecta]|uniref:uncharacterized protein LOC113564553 isoform X2 n=1 Tax=Drosophila erecta TaxID=7220 RepID=UPI000F065D19|nr:uncharacterized protein LOC113564553 isoform X2 [Drosophila erecta]
MARAKLNQWVVQLRDVGKVLRCNLPIMDKANWVLSRIQISLKSARIIEIITNPKSKKR